MVKIKTSTSLILLLPLLLFNFPVVAADLCPSLAAMQKMACCQTVANQCEKPTPAFSNAKCGCYFSGQSHTETPLIHSAELIKINPKELHNCVTQIVSAFNFDEEQTHLDFFFFDVNQQPKFRHNLKIYIFISSYLI